MPHWLISVLLALALLVAPVLTMVPDKPADAEKQAIVKIQEALKEIGIATVTVGGQEKHLATDGIWNDATQIAIVSYLRVYSGDKTDVPTDKTSLIAMARQALGVSAPENFDWWRFAAWVTSLAMSLALLITWGRWFKGRAAGLLIDRRNRFSLSRLQIVAWTILILPTIAVCLGNNALRAESIIGIPPLALDWTLFILMGISLGSFVSAPAVLYLKTTRAANPAEVAEARKRLAEQDDTDEASVLVEGQLVKKADPSNARLKDLLCGEETGNAATVDIARVQMLGLTAIVWAAYATILARLMSDGMLWTIPKVPSLDGTLLALISVSHVGYIAGKVSPNSSRPSDVAARTLSRVLTLLNRLDSLAQQVKTTLLVDNLAPVEERQVKRVRAQIDRLQADVEGEQTKLGTGEDVSEAIARFEGQLDAMLSAYRSVAAEGGRPANVNEPGPDLIRALKRGLAKAAGTKVSNADIWTSADDTDLNKFLTDQGLTLKDLHPRRYRAFEEVLELLD